PAPPPRGKASASQAFVTAPTAPALDAGFHPNVAETRPLGPPPSAPKRSRVTSNGSSPPSSVGSGPFGTSRQPSFEARGPIVPDLAVRRPPTPARLWVLAGAGAVGLAGLTVAGYWIFSGDSGVKPPKATVADTEPKVEAPAPPVAVDPASGFDIATDPQGA